jgi:hypothetical protein
MGSLVTKKLIIGEGFTPRGYSPGLWICANNRLQASTTAPETIRAEDVIFVI